MTHSGARFQVIHLTEITTFVYFTEITFMSKKGAISENRRLGSVFLKFKRAETRLGL